MNADNGELLIGPSLSALGLVRESRVSPDEQTETNRRNQRCLGHRRKHNGIAHIGRGDDQRPKYDTQRNEDERSHEALSQYRIQLSSLPRLG